MKKIKRVMLVYPNQRWFKFDLTTTWDLSPYTLCMLATMLEGKYELAIVDCQRYGLTQEQFKLRLEEFKPDCVGISLLTSEYAAILDTCAHIVKKVNKNIITIAGGVHVTTQYFKVIENKDIDYCVRGEGERVLPQLLAYLNGEADFPTKGVVYRDEKKKIVALPPDLIEDLDSLPLPDYELVDYRAYVDKKPRYGVDMVNVFPYARILTSRGCPFGCCFCQVKNISGARWRPRSAKKVIEEIGYLKEKYGIKSFIIEDDNAFVQKARTKEMLLLLKGANLRLKWKAAGVPVFMMDEEIFKLMADTGCEMIGVAIESGSERILKKIIKKPVDLKKVPGLIQLAKKQGIFVAANFIIGFPGETWEEIRQTLKYAEACGADYCKIYNAQPLIGTELYEIAKKMNAIVGDENAVNWRYGRIKSDEFTPKDISILRAYEWDRINFTDPVRLAKIAAIMGISVNELNQIRKATRDSLQF
ncbi:MAG: radical SAM protein [Candidatus Omnitrophica bacterium]|nr:radical SAM protein [Candidatus Omnitrophota bacterium]